MTGAPDRPMETAAASSTAEKDLVDGLLAGDRAAISDFLDRTHHPVFCMACRFTRDPELRRDWAHATLLGVLEDLKLGRFVYRRPGSFWAWFRKRAHFRLLDQYRSHQRTAGREVATGQDEGEDRGLPGATGPIDPAEAMDGVELLSAIEACLGRLPNAQQRRALGLLLLEDLTYQDIADALAAPLNTVRAWIRRGRLDLRRCLAQALGLEAQR
jgi:RNA polymerase sigma-70 factor (ECF subfamily)